MSIRNKKTAIYGGSFDPVHKGHTYIISRLTERFDRVIVVPAFVSPFKDRHGANAAARVEMLRLALRDEKINAEVSDFESKKPQTSYTIDTVRHFTAVDEKLYFVLGAENLHSLNRWKDFDELKNLTAFYAIPRHGKPAIPQGVLAEIADFKVDEDISSSLIKTALAFDRVFGTHKADLMLSRAVIDYIAAKGLYGDYDAYVGGLKAFGLTQERVEHTYLAAKCAIRLAKLHGVNVDKALTAAIMHDVGKETDSAEYGDFSNMPRPCRHAFIGAEIAERDLGITDSEIIGAIRYHTTARPEMTKLEKVIFLADALEESRDLEREKGALDVIRAAADTDLDLAMMLALKDLTAHLKNKGGEIYGLTQEAYQYYLETNNR